MCGRFQSKRDQKVFIPTSFSLMASNSAAKELVCWGLFSKLLPSSNPLFSIAACNSSLFSWNPEMDKFLGENIFSSEVGPLTLVCLSESADLRLHLRDPCWQISGGFLDDEPGAIVLDDDSSTSASSLLGVSPTLFHLAAQLLQMTG